MSTFFRNPYYNWTPPIQLGRQLTDDEKLWYSKGWVGQRFLLLRWWIVRELLPAIYWTIVELVLLFPHLPLVQWSRLWLKRSFRFLRTLIRATPLWDRLATLLLLWGRLQLAFLFALLSDLSTGVQRAGLALFRLHHLAFLPPLWYLLLRPLLVSALHLRNLTLQLKRGVRQRGERTATHLHRFRSIKGRVLLLLLLGVAGLFIWALQFLNPLIHHAASPFQFDCSPYLPLQQGSRRFWNQSEPVGYYLHAFLHLSLLFLPFTAAVPLIWKRWAPSSPTHKLGWTIYTKRPRVRYYQLLFGGLLFLSVILLPLYVTYILWKTWTTYPFSLYYHPYIWVRGLWLISIMGCVYAAKIKWSEEARTYYHYDYRNRVKWGRWMQFTYQYDSMLQHYFPMEYESKRYLKTLGPPQVAAKLYFSESEEHVAAVRVETLADKVPIAALLHVDFRDWRYELQKFLYYERKAWGYRLGYVKRRTLNYRHWRYEFTARPPGQLKRESKEKRYRRMERLWEAKEAGKWSEEKEQLEAGYRKQMAEAWDSWWRKETPWDYNFWTYYEEIEGRDPPDPEFSPDFSTRFLNYTPPERMEGVGENAEYTPPYYDENYHHPQFRYNRRYA